MDANGIPRSGTGTLLSLESHFETMTEEPDGLARFKRPLLYVMGPMYVLAGLAHFVAPDAYEQAIPPSFPRPRALVHLSGVAEVALGLGVLHPKTREASAWGLVALLVAVFPANLHLATEDGAEAVAPDGSESLVRAASIARLPFQAVLAAWAWWYTRALPEE